MTYAKFTSTSTYIILFAICSTSPYKQKEHRHMDLQTTLKCFLIKLGGGGEGASYLLHNYHTLKTPRTLNRNISCSLC